MKLEISAIKRLKDLTGVGLTDAKNALIESKGDFDKALQEMRKKGLTKAEKRSEREAREGVIGTYNHDNRIGVILEVNCETDFVAKNEIFSNLVKDLAMQIAAANPSYLSLDKVSSKDKEEISKEFQQKAITENKPKEMIDRIVTNQTDKYFSEKCLLEQEYIKDPNIKVKDLLNEHIAKLGENIVIKRFHRMSLGEVSAS